MIHRRDLSYNKAPINLYQIIRDNFANTILLESMDGPKHMATQSVICFSPEALVELDNNCLYLNHQLVTRSFNESIDYLRSLINKYSLDQPKSQFQGGLVGFTSYDLVSSYEKLPNAGNKEYPDGLYGLYLDGIIIDHIKSTVQYFWHTKVKNRFQEVQKVIEDYEADQNKEPQTFKALNVKFPTKALEFEDVVKDVKQRIHAGETFQTVISQQATFYLQGNKFSLYDKLRCINPSPYMYFLELEGYCIIGSSPELLISKEGDLLTTFPIAGTRKLTDNPDKNKTIAEELLSDEKEIAEHNMLVDLARNDIGRISQYGTVEVPSYQTVEYFSHVMHIVSKVTGQINPQKDQFDAFLSLFPAGTVSGAPKVRAMEIIANLEAKRRGPYAGSVGYFGIDGNMVQAIAIRTAFGKGRNFKLQAGAGIVYDSQPHLEYTETLNKLEVLLEAIAVEEGI